MSAAESRTQALVGPAVLFLIVVGFFWKLILTKQYSWLESPDFANQVVPWLNYQAQQFHLHRFPIWDPFLFGGQSLIGQGQPGLAYPLNWILFSLPLVNGHINLDVLNWYLLSIHYLGALFCYWLCRDLGRSVTASVFAGVAFGMGGYIGNTDWPQMINGAIWGPLVFLFLFRAARGERPIASAAFSGLFLGVSWLGGHHQIPIFLTLAAGGVWLYFLLEGGRVRRTLLAPAAVFVAFFILAGALQMWPAYEYGHLALRWVGSQHDPIAWNEPVPYTVHQQYSISPIYLLGILIPGYADHTSPFAGIVALAIASLALACWWKTKEVRILFGVGIAGLLLAIAKNDIFHGILYSIVPLFEKARSPSTAIYLFHFAIAVLMAFGLDAIFLSVHHPERRRLAFILLGFAVLIFLIIFGVDLGHALAWTFDDRVVMGPLIALLLAALIYRSSQTDASRGWLSVLIIGLYILEIGNQTFFGLVARDNTNMSIYLKRFDATKDVAGFLKRQQEQVRANLVREDVEFNFGDWYGIDSMQGILPSLPASLCDLNFAAERTRLLYGTNYAVARKPTMDGEQEVFRDGNGLMVFRNPRAFPRVFTVHEAILAKDKEHVARIMDDASFDLRTKTFGYTPPPDMEHCSGDTVESFSRDTNSSTAIVDMKCRGMLVESENNAPGWTATVDGQAAPIYEAYTALRGVLVGPGRHRIEMHYRPLSVLAGGFATLSAFLGALALSLAPRRRRG